MFWTVVYAFPIVYYQQINVFILSLPVSQMALWSFPDVPSNLI